MSEYPVNDDQFEDVTISEVEAEVGGGWSIKRSDGWSFYVPAESPVVPKVGMAARFYGRGIGSAVRGLFLNGECVFYRTPAEDAVQHNERTYGADATNWLARWDRGDTVWSVEMGGLGPGYEQAIQITIAEILRHLLATVYDHAAWSDAGAWKRDRDTIETACLSNPTIKSLGLSGAQWGAAMSVATALYMRGPVAIMTDPELKSDRKIQVSKRFPTVE